MAHSGGDAPALVCHVPDHDHAWVHLSATVDPAGVDGEPEVLGWTLTLGYPSDAEPWAHFDETALDLPEQAVMLDWSAAIYARLHLPGKTDPTQIAALITRLMTHVQGIAESERIEIALEYK